MAWIIRRTLSSGRAVAHVQWRDPESGRVRSKSLASGDPELAELERRRIEQAEERREGAARGAITDDAREALRRFLAHLKLTRSAATVRYYERCLRAVWAGMAGVAMPRWSRALLEAWLADRTSRDAAGESAWSPRTIQMHLAACRRFVRWAQEAGDAVVPDFVGRLRGPTIHRSAPETLTREQLDRLLGSMEGDPLEVPVALAGLAGLRRAEWLRAQAGDLDWKDLLLQIRGSKTHQDRAVPVGPRLAQVLRRHPRASGALCRAGGDVRALDRRLRTAARRAGIPRVGWHLLRHTCATLMVREGARLTAVRDILGHRDLSTTSIYTHSSDADRREAVARILG